jgi:Streptomyces sporulation and cell division protein, SsgA
MNEHRDDPPVTAELSARVLWPGSGSVSARIHLQYRSADPFAVLMIIRVRGSEERIWTFGRELLDDGLRRVSGVGAVTVEPCPQAPNLLLHVILRDDVSEAALELRRAPIAEFVSRAYDMVPAGHERLFLLVDDDVSALAS